MTAKDIDTLRAEYRERYHRRTAERRSKGLCVHCGERPPKPGRSRCEPCAAKKRPAHRARYHRRTAERVARGLCPKCGLCGIPHNPHLMHRPPSLRSATRRW